MSHPAIRALAALSLSLVSTTALAQQDQGSSTGQTADPEAGSGQGDTASKPAPKAPDALFGDWGGVRSSLADAGITLTIGYKGEFAANLQGGERKDATETGQFAFTGAYDMTKIGDPGGTLQATITYRNGVDLGARAGLGVLQQVQEVYGRGETWRLTELFFQQKLADGHVIFKLGRFPAGEFNLFDCEFMNLSFCGAPAGNITGTYWYNYPVAQWSGWVKFQSSQFYLKLGANEDNRNNLDEAFFISRGGAEGVILHAEAGWTPSLGDGRPALIKAGYWHTSGHDPDVLLDINHDLAPLTGLPFLERHGEYGYYVQGQVQLTGNATMDPVGNTFTRTRGLNAFFNFTRNDPRTATTIDQESIGLYYSAPFKGRPKDQLGFALGRTAYNGRAAKALLLADPSSEKPRAEYVGEFYYAAALMPGVSVRPNIQFIKDPGGYDRATDVIVFGTRFDVNF